jgi:hypothetical protein
MARGFYDGYYERRVARARLRSARNGKVPGGKPRGMCTVPGCTAWGTDCYFPDHGWGGPDGSPRKGPDECLCDRHIKHSGFCKGCGGFAGGIESFDFGTHGYPGFCDDCAWQIRAEEDRERWWDDDYYGDSDPYYDEPTAIVVICGFPEEVFTP